MHPPRSARWPCYLARGPKAEAECCSTSMELVSAVCCGRCSRPRMLLTAQHPHLLLLDFPVTPEAWGLATSIHRQVKSVWELKSHGVNVDQCEMGVRGCIFLSSCLSSMLFAGTIASFSFSENILRNQTVYHKAMASSVIYHLNICSPFLVLPSSYLTSTSLGFCFHKLLVLKRSLWVLSYRKPILREKAVKNRPEGESQNRKQRIYLVERHKR